VFDRLAGTTKELMPKFDRWVDEFVWAPDAKTIFFASGDHGEEKVFNIALDGEMAGEYSATVYTDTSGAHFGAEFGDLHVSPDGQFLVASGMSVDSPSNLYRFKISDFPATAVRSVSPTVTWQNQNGADLAAGKVFHTRADVLTHLNDATLAALDLSKIESYWFEGAAGVKVQGFIVRPPNFDPVKKYPVKFLIHGGPQGAWGDAWSYRWNPELMAASGYVVVMVNPRGSTGYGQKFVEGVSGDWGGKPYVDLMKGLDYAEQHYPFIDKTRECALGGSYGGYMADWILTHTNRFACIVTHDGMFNPASAYGTTEELWFNEWEFRRSPATGAAVWDKDAAQPWRYQSLPAEQDPFRKWSPMLSIKNAKTPTLVIHSQRDYRLDVSEGFQLFTALQRLGVPSKMLYFPDEGHWVLKPQNSKLWYETVGDWCDKWTKSGRYAGQ